MTEFQIRSDNVDVEQIMRQIRSRIREKRGVDYTEEEIKELARVKLEKFLDPTGVRSDLLAQFRRANSEGPARNYKFEDTTLFDSSRGWLRAVRRWLQPILKLFFNPNPLIDALHIQAELNETTSKRGDLQYELIHNLVLETTRLGIQVKNLKMQVESMSSRLDFDERRARALEGVVQYRPGAVPPLQPPISTARREAREESTQERRTRRRRRRGRRPAREESGAGYGEASTSAGRDSDAGYGEARGNSAPDVSQSGQVQRAERHDIRNLHTEQREQEPVSPKPLDDSRGHRGEPRDLRADAGRPVLPEPVEMRGGEGPVAPKPLDASPGEGPVAPKPLDASRGEGG